MRLNEAKDRKLPGTWKPCAETSLHALPGLRARPSPCLSWQCVLAPRRSRVQAAGPQLKGDSTEPSEPIAEPGPLGLEERGGLVSRAGAFLPQLQPGLGWFLLSGRHCVAAHVVRPPASPGSRCLEFSQRIFLMPTLCQASCLARSLSVGHQLGKREVSLPSLLKAGDLPCLTPWLDTKLVDHLQGRGRWDPRKHMLSLHDSQDAIRTHVVRNPEPPTPAVPGPPLREPERVSSAQHL